MQEKRALNPQEIPGCPMTNFGLLIMGQQYSPGVIVTTLILQI